MGCWCKAWEGGGIWGNRAEKLVWGDLSWSVPVITVCFWAQQSFSLNTALKFRNVNTSYNVNKCMNKYAIFLCQIQMTAIFFHWCTFSTFWYISDTYSFHKLQLDLFCLLQKKKKGQSKQYITVLMSYTKINYM